MVYFVGAGPGDPELITVKGRGVLEKADLVIYAGSLVNPELLRWTKEGCRIFNSAEMTLEDVITLITESIAAGETVVRLHTGDPSIFGALREQLDELDRRGIPYEIIPGVSSFCAAAAALHTEYTLPGVTQTVILTRMEGRTEVPGREAIADLARHRATMIIFLSVQFLRELVEALKKEYPANTPAAVVYRASWPEQKIIRSALETIVELVEKEPVKKTALVVVGDFLGNDYQLSRLYDRSFSHGYRSAQP